MAAVGQLAFRETFRPAGFRGLGHGPVQDVSHLGLFDVAMGGPHQLLAATCAYHWRTATHEFALTRDLSVILGS